MARCEQCGNDYDRPLRIELDAQAYDFDCFECAIQKLAPVCAHCGCRIIGHGIQADDTYYCCAHCARQSGVGDVADRSGQTREPG